MAYIQDREEGKKIVPGILEKSQEFPGFLEAEGKSNELKRIEAYSPVWPDGKKRARNVYAHSEAECEGLLAKMIAQMKAEIAGAKD